MTQVGYKFIDASGSVLETWGGVWGQCPEIPNLIRCPNGDHVHAPELNMPYDGCILSTWEMDEPVVEAPPAPPTPTVEELLLKLAEIQTQLSETAAQIVALRSP